MGEVVQFPQVVISDPADEVVPCAVCDNEEWLVRGDHRLECAYCGTEIDGALVHYQQPQEA